MNDRRMSRGLIYLASPYSSPYGHERAARAKSARRATEALVAAGEVVFCPVAYGHALDDTGRRSHEYWMQLCLPILTVAQRIYVLTLPGWNKSLGVREEVTLAARLGKPILGHNPFGSDEDDVSGSDIRRLCAMPVDALDDDAP